jgi:glycosyltransferase involved in cell wall biosynthesis
MPNKNPHISIVVPVYGCSACLVRLYERLLCIEKITGNFEIILVDDSSPDNAWKTIKEIVDIDPRVKGISFSKNFGQHYAITAGLDYSKGEWVVVMDCDLQDRPEEIVNLYKKCMEGYDVVLGRRNQRKDSFFKKLGSKCFYKVFSYLTETKQDGAVANFGIYNRKVIDTLISMRENLRFFPTMVGWTGYRVASINIEHDSRNDGKSSYSLKKLIQLALNVTLSFSDKPLRLTAKAGIFISFFSFLYALYILIRAFLGIRGIEGWPSLIVSIWFLSGLIIFILGIIGMYISRIFDEVKKRPIYIVREFYESTDNYVSYEPKGI